MSRRRLGQFPFGSLGLLAGLALTLGALGIGLAEVVKGLDPTFDLLIAGVGLGLAWWLGGTRLGRSTAALVLLASGVAVVVVRVGGLENDLGRTLWDLALSSAQRWPDPARLSDLSLLSADIRGLAAALRVLGERITAWAGVSLGGAPAYDPVAAAVLWGGLIWLCAAWAGWLARREESSLLGALPALITLMAAEAYAAGPILPVMLALVGLLVSLAFGAQAPVERRALSTYVDLPEGLAFQLARMVLPLAIALALIGAAAPQLSIETWVEQYRAWRESASRSDQGLASSLGVESGPSASRAGTSVENPGLPNRHLIGSGPELSQEVVMAVTVKPVAGIPSPPPYYWRSATYDQYTGHGWQTSPVTEQAFQSGELAISSLPIHHVQIRQAVQPVLPQGGRILAAGELVGLDAAYEVDWRTPGEDMFGVTGPAGDYVAKSAWPVNTPDELRAAPTELPDWVKARYLKLPDSVPAEVIGLGRDLTATQPTPYDRAVAIESYLRTIPYTLDVPQPPIDVDIVDYFLFNLKRGYCDYYASAMVVLARAAGIPARLAVGYASGASQVAADQSIRYTVTAADAHSWVEIYFPAFGWVPFEPTAGRPALGRGDDLGAAAAQGSETTETPSSAATPAAGRIAEIAIFLGWVLAGIVALGGAVIFVDQIRLRRLPAQLLAHSLMRRTRRLAEQWLGARLHDGDTPRQFELAVNTALLARETGMRWDAASGSLLATIGDLARFYEQAYFSSSPPSEIQSASLRKAWLVLAFRVIGLGLWARLVGGRGTEQQSSLVGGARRLR